MLGSDEATNSPLITEMRVSSLPLSQTLISWFCLNRQIMACPTMEYSRMKLTMEGRLRHALSRTNNKKSEAVFVVYVKK